MTDSIYRQSAIDAIRKCNVKEVTPAYMLIDKAEAMTELMMLPSAQLERKKGKWILPNNPIAKANDEWICSGCHYLIGGKHNYCPNCGADMRGEE